MHSHSLPSNYLTFALLRGKVMTVSKLFVSVQRMDLCNTAAEVFDKE